MNLTDALHTEDFAMSRGCHCHAVMWGYAIELRTSGGGHYRVRIGVRAGSVVDLAAIGRRRAMLRR